MCLYGTNYLFKLSISYLDQETFELPLNSKVNLFVMLIQDWFA